MLATELMIDDWVLYEGEPHQIRQLGIYGVDRDGEDYPAICVGKPKGIWLILERNEIEPIPLTPEILEKNGFVKSVNVRDAPPYDNNIYYSINQDGNTIFWGWWQPDNTLLIATYSAGFITLNNVHELQHALRLCRIKKEIIL